MRARRLTSAKYSAAVRENYAGWKEQRAESKEQRAEG
jgi:hypothetical protein